MLVRDFPCRREKWVREKDTDNTSIFLLGHLYQQLVNCLFFCCALIKSRNVYWNLSSGIGIWNSCFIFPFASPLASIPSTDYNFLESSNVWSEKLFLSLTEKNEQKSRQEMSNKKISLLVFSGINSSCSQ